MALGKVDIDLLISDFKQLDPLLISIEATLRPALEQPNLKDPLYSTALLRLAERISTLRPHLLWAIGQLEVIKESAPDETGEIEVPVGP